MLNNIKIYCSIYNRNFTIDDVKTFVEQINNKELAYAFDEILTLNTMTKDKQKAECLKLIFSEQKKRNLVGYYRNPQNGFRHNLKSLEDFYSAMCGTIYSSVIKEMIG